MPRLADKGVNLISVDANGGRVSGALLYAFESGTTTPKTIYLDAALTTPAATPVVADSAGIFAPLYAPAGDIKIDMRDPDTSASLPGFPVDDIGVGSSVRYDSVAALQASTEAARGAGAIWEAGGFRFVEAPSAATDHHLTTAAGVKLYVQPGTAGFDATPFGTFTDGVIAENPDPAAVFTTYDVSGTDNGAIFNGAIEATIEGEAGVLNIPAGQYYVSTDIVLDAGLGVEARGLTLRGHGDSSTYHVQYGGAPNGTSILCETGTSFSGGQPGLSIEGVAIYGQTIGTFLDIDSGFVQGGGLRQATVINNATDASYDASVAVKVSALFVTATRDSRIIGRRDFRAVFDDTSVDSADLYYGTGLMLDTTGQGGIGQTENTTISGFATGLKIEAPTVSSSQRTAYMPLDGMQFSYCQTGLYVGQGAEHIELRAPFFEYCLDESIRFGDGAGTLKIKGGRIGGSSRTYDDGSGAVTQRVKNAGIVCTGAWDQLDVDGADFVVNAAGNSAVMLEAGAGAGIAILNNVGTGGGGVLVAIDMTDAAAGVPDVWIKGGVRTDVTQGSALSTSRFICTFTRNSAYQLHTFTDANWLGRVEGAVINIDAGALSAGALDFTGRRFMPFAIEPNISTALTITLSDTIWPGQRMTISKRFAAGALDLTIPAGVAVNYNNAGTWTRQAGASTLQLAASGTGNWEIEKTAGDEYVVYD